MTRAAAALILLLAAAGAVGIYSVVAAPTLAILSWVAYRRPRAALTLVILTSPVVAVGSLDVGFNLLPNYIVTAAAAAGAVKRQQWRGVAWQPFELALLGFGIVAIATTVGTAGVEPDTTVLGATGANSPSVRGFAQLLALVVMLIVYALVRTMIRSSADLWQACRALGVTVCLVASYALYQFAARLLGLPFAFVNERRSLEELPIDAGYVRVNGPLPEASPLAQFLLIGVLLGLALLSSAAPQERETPRRHAMLLLVLSLMALAATLSKAGLAASFIALSFFLLIRRELWHQLSGRTRLLAGGAASVLLAGLVLRAQSALFDPSTIFASERLVRVGYWDAAIRIFADHPFGVGVGRYAFYYPSYAPISTQYEYFTGIADAHNWYLEALAETGFIGLILFLGFLVALTVKGFGVGGSSPSAGITTALTCAFLGGLLMHLTYSYFYYPFEWVLAGVVGAGATLNHHRINRGSRTAPPPHPRL